MRTRRTLILATACAVIALTVSACSLRGESSPTSTMVAFNEAMRGKDSEAIKKMLSKASLQLIAADAKVGGGTVDEAIQSGLGKVPADLKLPEMRNEKIKGNIATVEVKDEEKRLWFPVMLVKEEGEWKVAYDNAMRDPNHKMRGKPFDEQVLNK